MPTLLKIFFGGEEQAALQKVSLLVVSLMTEDFSPSLVFSKHLASLDVK